MADFSIASQIQPYKTPDVLGVAEHVQKMQTSNMLMQQRAAELQKENALRAAAAQHGVNSRAYAEAAGRIDPEAGLKAFTYQRQQAAAGAAAAAAARAAELDRIRADTATVDLVNKHGARFEQALRMVDTTENPAATYDKLYGMLPPTLKPLYPDKYSPDAVQRALMTNAEVVAAAAPKAPTIYPGTAEMPMQAYVPGKNGALGTTMVVPEVPPPGGVNNLAQPSAANALITPASSLTPSQARAQLAEQKRQDAAAKVETPEQKLDFERKKLEQRAQFELEKEYPVKKASVDATIGDIDAQIERAKSLKSHKGLSYITGGIMGRLPSVSEEGTSAQADLDQLKAKAGFEALQAMRNSSPTGGALGNVSDAEGRRLEASAAALAQAQGTKAFQSKLDAYIKDLERSKKSLTNAFDMQYGSVKPKTSPSVDDLLKKYE